MKRQNIVRWQDFSNRCTKMALSAGCQLVWTPGCSIAGVVGSRGARKSGRIGSNSSIFVENLHHCTCGPKVLPSVSAVLRTASINNAHSSKRDRHKQALQKHESQRTSFAKGIHLFQKHETKSRLSARKPIPTRAILNPFISQAATDKTIQLPINYYQVLQADKLSLPEKIVRAYDARVREVPGDGAPYSKSALAAREELLLVRPIWLIPLFKSEKCSGQDVPYVSWWWAVIWMLALR